MNTAPFSPPPQHIEVLAIKPVQGHGNLHAFFDLRLGGITIRGCRVVKQPGQRAYAQGPFDEVKRFAWVSFDEATRHAIQNVVLPQVQLPEDGGAR